MKKVIFGVLVLILLVVFRKFMLPGTLVWGDAPFFYPEGLKELVSFPSAWTSRGNSLGGVNTFIWIHPLMVLYGLLGTHLQVSNDFILRMLFYLPSLLLGIGGSYLLVKYFGFSKLVGLFTTMVYVINTYYLLLIDGGQVGVVLGYGLFPLGLLVLLRLGDKFSMRNFVTALVTVFGLTAVDFRLSAICFLTALVVVFRSWRKVRNIMLGGLCLAGLALYWIVPAVKLSFGSLSTDVTALQTTSLLNALLLFSPNWPGNEFGKTVAPYFYFSVVPILVFLPLFMTKEKKVIWYTLCFLFFAFLAKGTTPPLGGFYKILVSTQAGSVFRDSTKFFIPLLLFGGMLIGIGGERIGILLKNKRTVLLLRGGIMVFMLFLAKEAIVGQLNGVLGKNKDTRDYERVYQVVSKDDGFSRSAWFSEKSPFTFHSEEKQALDAKDLVNFRPFAYLNTGTGDRFNFVNRREYLEWFDLVGIKYLILSGNPRAAYPTRESEEEWERLISLVSNDTRLKKVEAGTSFPVFENLSIKPNKFFVDMTLLVVGGDDVYQKLKEVEKNFSIGNQGVVFLEDGKSDPRVLQQVASSAATLIFNEKQKEDLEMSFLQEKFRSVGSANSSGWARFTGHQYLDYKYQLLIRGVEFKDFDYGLGIAFSSEKGEKINFRFNVFQEGNYILAVRKLDGVTNRMRWYFENKTLQEGTFEYSYENKAGMEVLNVVALVPLAEMEQARNLTEDFLGHFRRYDLNKTNNRAELQNLLRNNKWKKLDETENMSGAGFIIYTDSFNPNWRVVKKSGEFASIPMYSMINGLYVDSGLNGIEVQFKGNEDVRWGMYFSALTLVMISLVCVWKMVGKEAVNERKNTKSD